MDEENKKPDNSEENLDEENKPKANEEVERLNADTERINKAIAENANAKAQQDLGGVAEAGQTKVEKTEDEKWAEDAKKRYEGTGMSPVEGDDGK